MWIYLANLLSLPVYKAVIKNRKLFCVVVSMQLFLILALRDATLGIDLPTYSSGYQLICGFSFREMLSKLSLIGRARLIYPFSFESGYVFLNWIVSRFGLSFHGFLVVCAIINCVSVGCFVYRYSRNEMLSFCIFISFNMYSYCFGIIRQSLALSILLWAVPYIINNKRVQALFIIFLASLFHMSAYIWIPFVFVSGLSVKRNRMLGIVVLGCLLTLVAPFIYRNLISIILPRLGVNHTKINFRINNFAILIVIFAVIIYLFIDFRVFENASLRAACWGFLALFLIEPLALCNDAFARSTELYAIFLIILIPELIRTYKEQNSKIMIDILAYVLMFGFLVYSLSRNGDIVPYKSIFG